MTRDTVRIAVPIFALLLSAAPALVAQSDKIHKVDGSMIESVRVKDFTVQELTYTEGGSNKTLSSDQVASLELAGFKDAYKRGLAGNDPGQLLTVAREQVKRNKVMAQMGFVRAASLFLEYDDGEASAVAALDEMTQEFPEGGFVPELYRQKLGVYLGRGPAGAKNALAVATKFGDAASSGGWPQGFIYEANFFKALAEASGGSLEAGAFQGRMRQILGDTLGTFPNIANRANAQLANSLRIDEKTDDARAIYESLLGQDGVETNVRAQAYVGMGHLKMATGSTTEKQAYKEAMLLFLRPYIETPEAWGSTIAEGLYNAAICAERWGGTDAREMAYRLRGRLKSQYPTSEFTERLSK